MEIETRALLIFIGTGLVIGFIAALSLGEEGTILRYLIASLIGAFAGGHLFDVMGINLGIRNRPVSQVVAASIGAIIVILPARFIA